MHNKAIFGAQYYVDSIAIYGDIAIMGSPREYSNKGSAYIFEKSSLIGIWSQSTNISPNDISETARFSKAVSVENNVIVFGAPLDRTGQQGSAYSKSSCCVLFVVIFERK